MTEPSPVRYVFILIERGYDHERLLAAYLDVADAITAAQGVQWPLTRIDGEPTDIDPDEFHRVLVIERLALL